MEKGKQFGKELSRFRKWVKESAVAGHTLREQVSAYHRTFPGRVLLLAVELIAAALLIDDVQHFIIPENERKP